MIREESKELSYKNTPNHMTNECAIRKAQVFLEI